MECGGQLWRLDVGMSCGVLNAAPQVSLMDVQQLDSCDSGVGLSWPCQLAHGGAHKQDGTALNRRGAKGNDVSWNGCRSSKSPEMHVDGVSNACSRPFRSQMAYPLACHTARFGGEATGYFWEVAWHSYQA